MTHLTGSLFPFLLFSYVNIFELNINKLFLFVYLVFHFEWSACSSSAYACKLVQGSVEWKRVTRVKVGRFRISKLAIAI